MGSHMTVELAEDRDGKAMIASRHEWERDRNLNKMIAV